MTGLLGVWGIGGCGRGIMPLLANMPEAADARLVFVDDGAEQDSVNGRDVLSFNEFCSENADSKALALAVAAGSVRARLAERCDAVGLPLLSVWAENAMTMDDVLIGEGALISPGVVFTSNIRVGRAFHANIHSIIEHDAVIGDFVTFAPGVRCNGNVTIGDFAYIGAGAVIRQGLTIGAGATIGMGAVVTKDVAPGVTVIGSPARPLVKA